MRHAPCKPRQAYPRMDELNRAAGSLVPQVPPAGGEPQPVAGRDGERHRRVCRRRGIVRKKSALVQADGGLQIRRGRFEKSRRRHQSVAGSFQEEEPRTVSILNCQKVRNSNGKIGLGACSRNRSLQSSPRNNITSTAACGLTSEEHVLTELQIIIKNREPIDWLAPPSVSLDDEHISNDPQLLQMVLMPAVQNLRGHSRHPGPRESGSGRAKPVRRLAPTTAMPRLSSLFGRSSRGACSLSASTCGPRTRRRPPAAGDTRSTSSCAPCSRQSSSSGSGDHPFLLDEYPDLFLPPRAIL